MTRTLRTLLLCFAAVGCTSDHNLGDTNGSGSDAPPFTTTRWALTLGGPGDDTTTSVAVDSAGDVIAGGYFASTVDFGDQSATASNQAAWISKRSGDDGHAIWTRVIGTEPSASAIASIALGPDDSIVVSGGFLGDITIGTFTLHGTPFAPLGMASASSFVAKYDRDGNAVWAESLNLDGIERLAVAADGKIAITGPLAGTVSTANGDVSPGDYASVAIVLLASDGTAQWATTVQDPLGNFDGIDDLVVTPEDDLLVIGDLDRLAILGTQPLITDPNSWANTFIARISVAGEVLWTMVLGTPTEPYSGGRIVADASSNVIVTMQSQDSNLDTWITVMQLSPGGTTDWTFHTPNDAGIYVGAEVVVGSNQLVVGGRFVGPIALGDMDEAPYQGLGTGTYLLEQDASGNLIGAEGFANGDGGETSSFAAGIGASFALGGEVSGPDDLGTGPLRFAGGVDAVIAMFDVN